MVWNYWTEPTRFIFISNWFLINSFLLLVVWQNLTQAITNEQRDSIVNTYVVHDILGCSVAGHVRVRCIEYIFAQSVYSLCICVCTPSIFTSVMCNIFNHQLLQLQLLKETTVSRVVTKISSCRVNTTSRWGIKWLGISFGSIFLLFSNKSSRGPLS